MGKDWVKAVIRLYDSGTWRFPDAGRRSGYSVVLFGPHGRYRHPAPATVASMRSIPGISSVQITFHEDREPAAHAMPEGGFRLAIVNTHCLQAGLAARERLKAAFLPEAARP